VCEGRVDVVLAVDALAEEEAAQVTHVHADEEESGLVHLARIRAGDDDGRADAVGVGLDLHLRRLDPELEQEQREERGCLHDFDGTS